MSKLWILLLVPFLLGADYVCSDKGEIYYKRKSIDGSNLDKDKCFQVTREAFNTITKWHKVVDGKVVEKTQVEKDAIILAEADVQAQAIEDALDRYEINNIELITALVQVINERIPSNPITKTEIINKIKANR